MSFALGVPLTSSRYAGGHARMLHANMKSTQADFRRKADAFFKYAEYDQHVVSVTLET
jgi:hypothetical protein